MKTSFSAAERPNPVETDGTGFGLHMLAGNVLTLNLHYAELSGIATAAHIHGPATTEQSIGVLVDLEPLNGEGFGASGRLWGRVMLDPNVLGHVVNSMTYINVHTMAHTPGEVRGQLSP